MSVYIPEKTRQFVANRANFCCEYCLISQEDSFFSFHIEHIISLKHGGTSSVDNLCFSCQVCNLNKGTDLGTVIDKSDQLIRFFNPRIDKWFNHFEIESSGEIIPITAIGESTLKILDLNQPDAIIERKEMLRLGFI